MPSRPTRATSRRRPAAPSGGAREPVLTVVALLVVLASWSLATPACAEPRPVPPGSLEPASADAAAPVADAGVGATPPVVALQPTPAPSTVANPLVGDTDAMAHFLDRLMLAESGGRDDAKNPRSTALGPFQFIESTFLEVCRRHFAAETQGLTVPQVLALRSNRAFARRAAQAFTLDNAAILASHGHATTTSNLRLAFLVGAGAAVKLLAAPPETPVIGILGAAVVQANPFMAGMTSADLAAWSGRNLAAGRTAVIAPRPGAQAGATAAAPRAARVQPTCNTQLPACRRWVALAERRVARPVAALPAAKPKQPAR